MPIKIDRDGSFEIDYAGPYAGLNVQAPANLIQDNSSPALSNFILRNAELRSRPTFVQEFQGPDTNPILGLASFQDANNTYHTVTWTTAGLYQLKPVGSRGVGSPWVAISGANIITGNPVTWGAFANVLYFTNGGTSLGSWDGVAAAATTNVATAVAANFPWAAGTVNFGGYFIAELASHLLLANLTATDGTNTRYYQQRLWWSASGIPTVWDPTVNTSAGFNDFLDCPDSITGLATVGIEGYVFRSQGITQFTATGSGALPFNFDHLWASDHGVGNVYPWSIAQYGPYLCFISIEQIYQIGINTFAPIGGVARDSILADLAVAMGKPTANIVGNFLLNYSYFGYLISIPLSSGTRYYFFSFEDQSWSQWTTSNQIQTGREAEVWI